MGRVAVAATTCSTYTQDLLCDAPSCGQTPRACPKTIPERVLSNFDASAPGRARVSEFAQTKLEQRDSLERVSGDSGELPSQCRSTWCCFWLDLADQIRSNLVEFRNHLVKFSQPCSKLAGQRTGLARNTITGERLSTVWRFFPLLPTRRMARERIFSKCVFCECVFCECVGGAARRHLRLGVAAVEEGGVAAQYRRC